MSLLRASELRVILKEAGTLSDISEEMRDFSDDSRDVAWVSATDALYLGYKHKFNHRYFKSGAVLTRAVMTVSYWTGSVFTPFVDVVDETEGLSKSGFIAWEETTAWQPATKNSISELETYSPVDGLYWVKIQISDDLSRKLEAFKFLLSDDRILNHLYPEIMNYLPSGKDDFLVQHELAAEAIVNLLKVKKLIAYREQIKNPDDWLMAATYKALELILAPIPGDERIAAVKKDMADQASVHLNIASASIDADKSETLDDDESSDGKNTTGSTTGWSTR